MHVSLVSTYYLGTTLLLPPSRRSTIIDRVGGLNRSKARKGVCLVKSQGHPTSPTIASKVASHSGLLYVIRIGHHARSWQCVEAHLLDMRAHVVDTIR